MDLPNLMRLRKSNITYWKKWKGPRSYKCHESGLAWHRHFVCSKPVCPQIMIRSKFHHIVQPVIQNTSCISVSWDERDLFSRPNSSKICTIIAQLVSALYVLLVASILLLLARIDAQTDTDIKTLDKSSRDGVRKKQFDDLFEKWISMAACKLADLFAASLCTASLRSHTNYHFIVAWNREIERWIPSRERLLLIPSLLDMESILGRPKQLMEILKSEEIGKCPQLFHDKSYLKTLILQRWSLFDAVVKPNTQARFPIQIHLLCMARMPF